MAQHFRSKITPTELRQTLADLGLSQQRFAKLTCIARESVCKACNSRDFISRDIALALRLAQVIIGLRAIVHDRHKRPGWRNVKAVLSLAEDPIVLQKRKKGKTGGKYRPRRPHVTPAADPPPVGRLPAHNHLPGPCPKGYFWQMRGHTWTLQPDSPVRDGII